MAVGKLLSFRSSNINKAFGYKYILISYYRERHSTTFKKLFPVVILVDGF